MQSPNAISELGMYLGWSYKLEEKKIHTARPLEGESTNVYTMYIWSQLKSKEILTLLNVKFLAEN